MLILDADALIKLNRAGVLELVGVSYEAVVPDAVYQEAVVRGMQRGFSDAAEIGEIIDKHMRVAPVGSIQSGIELASGLGPGEAQVLALALEVRTPESPAIVASDDRRFLSELSRLDLPFLVPSDVILAMRRDGILLIEAASTCLDSMRPFIQQSDYFHAMESLRE